VFVIKDDQLDADELEALMMFAAAVAGVGEQDRVGVRAGRARSAPGPARGALRLARSLGRFDARTDGRSLRCD
jgi:hypothetical protein